MRATHYLTVSATALLIGTTGLTSPAQAQTPASVAPTHVIYSFSALYRTAKESGSPKLRPRRGRSRQSLRRDRARRPQRCLSIRDHLSAGARRRRPGWTEQTLYAGFPSFGAALGATPLASRSGQCREYLRRRGMRRHGWRPARHRHGLGTQPAGHTGRAWELRRALYLQPPASGPNGGPDGGFPTAGLAMDRSGTLYGTTNYGGSADKGVVFSLTPPPPGGLAWTETVLHSFTGQKRRRPPNAPLVLSDHQTAISGTTLSGTVFRLRHQGGIWSYRRAGQLPAVTRRPACWRIELATCSARRTGAALHPTHSAACSNCPRPPWARPPGRSKSCTAFTGKDGRYPVAGLVAGGSPRALFGTTLFGGMGGAVDGSRGPYGVVFRLDPPASGSGAWTYTVLHAFDGPPRGKEAARPHSQRACLQAPAVRRVHARGFGQVRRRLRAEPAIPAAPPTGAAP